MISSIFYLQILVLPKKSKGSVKKASGSGRDEREHEAAEEGDHSRDSIFYGLKRNVRNSFYAAKE